MIPFNLTGTKLVCLNVNDVETFGVVLTEHTKFNISFIAVANALPICCHVRNTLNNISVRR